MSVFISHINEESKIAIVLKEWIESTFADQCKVFVSSDNEDIPAGSRWLDQITAALEDSRVLITICSPNSIVRPWINFETGCAWIKGIQVIPVCHSGLLKSKLPNPLSMFQALDLDQKDFCKLLISGVARHLRISKLPRIEFAKMAEELRTVQASLLNLQSGSFVQSHTPKEQKNRIEKIEEDILMKLADIGAVYNTELVEKFKIHPEKALYYLDKLLERKFVLMHEAAFGTDFRYSLLPKGREYLVENGLL